MFSIAFGKERKNIVYILVLNGISVLLSFQHELRGTCVYRLFA